LRKKIVPAKPVPDKAGDKAKRYGMSWALRLKRVFKIEIKNLYASFLEIQVLSVEKTIVSWRTNKLKEF